MLGPTSAASTHVLLPPKWCGSVWKVRCGSVVDWLWIGCGLVVDGLWVGCGLVVDRLWAGWLSGWLVSGLFRVYFLD